MHILWIFLTYLLKKKSYVWKQVFIKQTNKPCNKGQTKNPTFSIQFNVHVFVNTAHSSCGFRGRNCSNIFLKLFQCHLLSVNRKNRWKICYLFNFSGSGTPISFTHKKKKKTTYFVRVFFCCCCMFYPLCHLLFISFSKDCFAILIKLFYTLIFFLFVCISLIVLFYFFIPSSTLLLFNLSPCTFCYEGIVGCWSLELLVTLAFCLLICQSLGAWSSFWVVGRVGCWSSWLVGLVGC